MTTFMGKPCRRGHNGLRYASSGGCVFCQRSAESRRSEGIIFGPKSKDDILAALGTAERIALFRARQLLVVSLWTLPPRKAIRELIEDIDSLIDREAVVGIEKESRGD